MMLGEGEEVGPASVVESFEDVAGVMLVALDGSGDDPVGGDAFGMSWARDGIGLLDAGCASLI